LPTPESPIIKSFWPPRVSRVRAPGPSLPSPRFARSRGSDAQFLSGAVSSRAPARGRGRRTQVKRGSAILGGGHAECGRARRGGGEGELRVCGLFAPLRAVVVATNSGWPDLLPAPRRATHRPAIAWAAASAPRRPNPLPRSGPSSTRCSSAFNVATPRPARWSSTARRAVPPSRAKCARQSSCIRALRRTSPSRSMCTRLGWMTWTRTGRRTPVAARRAAVARSGRAQASEEDDKLLSIKATTAKHSAKPAEPESSDDDQ
jgi:hypothetical protein